MEERDIAAKGVDKTREAEGEDRNTWNGRSKRSRRKGNTGRRSKKWRRY